MNTFALFQIGLLSILQYIPVSTIIIMIQWNLRRVTTQIDIFLWKFTIVGMAYFFPTYNILIIEYIDWEMYIDNIIFKKRNKKKSTIHPITKIHLYRHIFPKKNKYKKQ